jgi:hypothetical protein
MLSIYAIVKALNVAQIAVTKQITIKLVSTRTGRTYRCGKEIFFREKVGNRLIFRNPATVTTKAAKMGEVTNASTPQKEKANGERAISAPAGAGTPVKKCVVQGNAEETADVVLKRARRREQHTQKKRQTLHPKLPNLCSIDRYKINAGLTPKLIISARESSSAPK